MQQLSYDEVFTYKNLYNSYKKCLKGVKWKGTVQHYNQHSLSMVYKTYLALKNRNVKTGKFFYFTIMERGKTRQIKSVAIYERVIQRCLCDYSLVPVLSSKFIYDNSACIKDKGMHFAIRRLKKNLHRFYLNYGDMNGYILQFDFHHFFDTIPHNKMIEMVSEIIRDKEICNLYSQLVNDFPNDKGLGLGSQISQISALYYPHIIDNAFANDKNLFAYARYMDDGYLICRDKHKLRKCKKTLYSLTNSINLELNNDKTRVYKMSCYMEFLKARIKINQNGILITKPNRKNITRNRKKLKKLKEKYDNGIIGLENIDMVYKTTYGNFQNFDAYKSKENYKRLFIELFKKGGIQNEISSL